jgi:ribonuclease P protein component
MLLKVNRLQKEKDIERVFKKGRGFKEDFLVLKTLKNDSNKIRFGFVVSQKVSKKANIRNKIKRRLSELVRSKLKSKVLTNYSDNLLIAAPGLEIKDFWEIEEAMNKLFQKAKLIN